MRGNEFLQRIFKTGEATDDEAIKFMIKHYFLKGHTLDDFEDDLIFKYNKPEEYSRALRDCFEDKLKKYSR